MSTEAPRLVRFSVFEVDLDAGELFKQGRKVKLQGQRFDLLAALMERPGEVVTREELKEKVWPSDTIVDFDQGLNRAVNKIREALGDSAQSPQFLETLPRRRYRFVAPVQTMHNFVAAPTLEPVELPTSSTAEVVQEAPIPTATSMPGLRRRWKLANPFAPGHFAYLCDAVQTNEEKTIPDRRRAESRRHRRRIGVAIKR